MSDKRIIYASPEGGICIVIPAHNVDLDFIIEKDVPKGISYSVVDSSEIPSDREFRNAWEDNGGSISINLDKAKVIKADSIRKERKPLLDSLDVEFVRALELGDTVKQVEVAQLKQKLRAAPSHSSLINAASIEELKNLKLDALI